MGLAARSTSTRALPFQNYKGRLTYLGGFSESGKTTRAKDEVEELRCPYLFFHTDVSNPGVAALPWVEDSDEDLEEVKANPLKTYGVRCVHRNPRILEYCNDHRRAVILDEIGNIFYDAGRMKTLLMWAREVRYKDGGLMVWATSQRAAADVWPGVYFAAHRIKWVGPLMDEKAQKVLFSHRNKDVDFQEFRAALRNLKPYSWRDKIERGTVYTVKDI